MPSDLEARIIALVAAAVPASLRRGITRDTHLKRELALDSIALLALVFRFERELGVDLTALGADVDVGRLRTVGDVVDTAAALLDRAKAAGAL